MSDGERVDKDGLRVSRVPLSSDDELIVISTPTGGGPEMSELLTASEREIAGLLLAGLSAKAISERRGSSVRTVTNQIQSIYHKHEVHSREELAVVLLAGVSPP